MAKFIFFIHIAIGLSSSVAFRSHNPIGVSRDVAFRSRPPPKNYPITRLTECSLCVYRSPSKMP